MHHPTNIKKEETPQVLPRSQASQVSATRSLYFILLNFIHLVKPFLQFSIVYADVIYHIPYTIFCGLFRNGNGFYILIIPYTNQQNIHNTLKFIIYSFWFHLM